MGLEHQGICYSGYREEHHPNEGHYPTPAQVEEDLRILARRWRHLRLYDSGPHAELVLSAIERLGLDMEVMLGAWLAAEVNNPGCPWGAEYSEESLALNRQLNQDQIDGVIRLARSYPKLVSSVSAGNECTVSWTGQMVPLPRVVDYVRQLKAALPVPVTTCENHVPWTEHLAPLVEELDFISAHVYPVWERKSIDEAIAATEADWQRIVERYPDKRVVITEAGWTTRSNGRGITPANANVDDQARYIEELTRWGHERGVFVYLFEAFDEPWKGSRDPDEPEKHWGLFTVDRRPKPAMHAHFEDLRA